VVDGDETTSIAEGSSLPHSAASRSFTMRSMMAHASQWSGAYASEPAIRNEGGRPRRLSTSPRVTDTRAESSVRKNRPGEDRCSIFGLSTIGFQELT